MVDRGDGDDDGDCGGVVVGVMNVVVMGGTAVYLIHGPRGMLGLRTYSPNVTHVTYACTVCTYQCIYELWLYDFSNRQFQLLVYACRG